MIAINKSNTDNIVYETIGAFPNVQEYPSKVPEIEYAAVAEYSDVTYMEYKRTSIPDGISFKRCYLFVRIYYESDTGRISVVQPDVVVEAVDGRAYGTVLSHMYTGDPSINDNYFDILIDMHQEGSSNVWSCLSPFLDVNSGCPLVCALSTDWPINGGTEDVVQFFPIPSDSDNPDFDTLSASDFEGLFKMNHKTYSELASWGVKGPSNGMEGYKSDYICL